MAKFFEWVGDKRKFRLLDQFSLGPTMMWMAYSGEGAKAIRENPIDWVAQTKSAAPPRDNAWPDSWDEIFHFYTSASAGDLGKKITYMDWPRSGIHWYPANDPTDKEKIVKWLTAHVGNANGAAAYAPRFEQSLALVLGLT
jgi:hypothetical protein